MIRKASSLTDAEMKWIAARTRGIFIERYGKFALQKFMKRDPEKLAHSTWLAIREFLDRNNITLEPENRIQ